MKGVQHQKLSFFVIEFDPIGSHPTTGVKDTRLNLEYPGSPVTVKGLVYLAVIGVKRIRQIITFEDITRKNSV